MEKHSWNSETEVGEIISALIKIHQCKNVLEIGTFKGATGAFMLDAKYTGIDISDHRDAEFKKGMKGHSFIIGNSIDVLPTLPQKSFDLIFIDSVHEFDHCMTEFKMCELLIKRGGLICFHDSIKFEGVKRVINYISMFKHFDVITLNTPENNGFTIVKCNYK